MEITACQSLEHICNRARSEHLPVVSSLVEGPTQGSARHKGPSKVHSSPSCTLPDASPPSLLARPSSLSPPPPSNYPHTPWRHDSNLHLAHVHTHTHKSPSGIIGLSVTPKAPTEADGSRQSPTGAPSAPPATLPQCPTRPHPCSRCTPAHVEVYVRSNVKMTRIKGGLRAVCEEAAKW